jgi:hypothetical protein
MADLLEQHRLQMIRLRAETAARHNGTAPGKPKAEPRPKPVVAPRIKAAPRENPRVQAQAKPVSVDLPGDELHAIYESLGVQRKSNCPCNAKIAEMNKFGSAGCRANFDEIVNWQREGMKQYTVTERATAAWHMMTSGLAFEIGVMNWADPFPALVDLAIKRAEAKLKAEQERQEAARRPFVLNPAARICVVTAYTPDNPTWLEIGRQTSATMRDYCERQGYGFRCHTDDFESWIHPSWSKIKFLKQALEHHETVLWIDADALVTNPYQRIEDLHAGPEELCIGTDPIAVNCGVILIRRSEFSTWFLDWVWRDRFSKNGLWEQDTINAMHKQGLLVNHLAVCKPRVFNSRCPTDGNVVCDWKPGDFVAHIYKTAGNIQRKASVIGGILASAVRGIDESKIAAAREYVASIPTYPSDKYSGRGIVTSAGGASLQLNSYVSLRLIRHLACTLPMECWYDGEREFDPVFRSALATLDVDYVNARQRGFEFTKPSDQVTHLGTGTKYASGENGYSNLAGYAMKPYAILNSRFNEVLWLDADNFAIRDPSFLFDDPNYREAGSMFWRDPPNGYGPNLRAFGVAGEFGAGTEAGQMLVNKDRCWRAINLDVWYNLDAGYWYQHSWGDPDCALAAWLATGTQLNLSLPVLNDNAIFGQHGPDGRLLFCHRVCRGNKLTQDEKWRRLSWFPHSDLCQQFIDDYRVLIGGNPHGILP